MTISAKLRFGGLNLRLVEGDLFDVGTAAIVNSEQTNFVLAAKESTISARLDVGSERAFRKSSMSRPEECHHHPATEATSLG